MLATVDDKPGDISIGNLGGERGFVPANRCRPSACIKPAFPFNEGTVAGRVTYWPDAFVKRIA